MIYSFNESPVGANPGYNPQSVLFRDAQGNLYGTTPLGGHERSECNGSDNGCGVAFKVSPEGKETILHSFTGNSTDGAIPAGGLVADSKHNLYGATYRGGANDCGTIFKLSPGTER